MTLSLGSLPLPLSVMAKVADSHTWTFKTIMADIRIRFEFHAKISVMALTSLVTSPRAPPGEKRFSS